MSEQDKKPPIRLTPPPQHEAEVAELAEHVGYAKAIRIMRGQER